MTQPLPAAQLVRMLTESRARTLALAASFRGDELIGPKLDIVNPPLWEIGHVGWFHEFFVLRRLEGCPPLLANTDALYNSSTVPHDARWNLPLPSLDGTLDYVARVTEALVERLRGDRASEA